MLETLKLSKGLAKLGNMFLVMFPGVAKLGNMFRPQNLCPRSKNVFDSRQNHFLFSSSKICFRNTFKVDRLQMIVVAKNLSVLQLFISRMPKMCAILQLISARLNWETLASATMFPQRFLV